jgi:hypothetical protein
MYVQTNKNKKFKLFILMWSAYIKLQNRREKKQSKHFFEACTLLEKRKFECILPLILIYDLQGLRDGFLRKKFSKLLFCISYIMLTIMI